MSASRTKTLLTSAPAWAWLPFAAIVVVLLMSALGHPVTQLAGANSSDDVIVNGTVPAEIHISPACGGTSVTIPALDPDGTAHETSAACDVTWGSNSDPDGTMLQVSDATAASSPGTPAMTCVTATSCGGASLPDASGTPLPVSATQSGFGVRLADSSGNAVPTWTENSGPAPAGRFYSVDDTPQTACTTPGHGDGTCSFHFAAAASGLQPSGTYQAQVLFEAYSN